MNKIIDFDAILNEGVIINKETVKNWKEQLKELLKNRIIQSGQYISIKVDDEQILDIFYYFDNTIHNGSSSYQLLINIGGFSEFGEKISDKYLNSILSKMLIRYIESKFIENNYNNDVFSYLDDYEYINDELDYIDLNFIDGK